MSCATGTIKYTLFVFNLLWAILGILVIVFGGLGWGAMPEDYAIGIIVFGCVIFLNSIVGCLGIVRESQRLLWTYVMMLFVLVVLIILSMWYNPRDTFKRYATKNVNDLWERMPEDPTAMDSIQIAYNCCGRESMYDYKQVNFEPPKSCYKGQTGFVTDVHRFGCLSEAEKGFDDEVLITQCFEWSLLSFAIILLGMSTVLAIHYMNRQRRYNY